MGGPPAHARQHIALLDWPATLRPNPAMGFNKRKMEDPRRDAAGPARASGARAQHLKVLQLLQWAHWLAVQIPFCGLHVAARVKLVLHGGDCTRHGVN